jgi:glucokinase
MRWLGVDIGGTNTKITVVDDRNWSVLERISVPTDRSAPPRTIAAACAAAAAVLARFPDIAGVGITIPGHFDLASGCAVVVPNIPGSWLGEPVRAPFEEALSRPCVLINDARAFGLGESRLGAGRGVRDVVALVLGTGIGGALVLDGRLHLGERGIASEIGHLVLQEDGPLCGCGNRGCLEALARSDVIADAAGAPDVSTAVALAETGDERARAAIRSAARWIGLGLANMVTLITPQRVVIGGGIAQAGEILLAPIRAQIEARTPLVPVGDYEVVVGVLGTWAGAIGAAVCSADAFPAVNQPLSITHREAI